MMCFLKLALMCSIIAASVVDLPQPVEPATSTMPRGDSAIFLIVSSRPSSSKLGTLRFDIAHGEAPLAALLEQVGAKPADAGNEIGEIDLAILLQPLASGARERSVSTTLFIHSSVGYGHSMATSWRLMRKMTGVPILRCTSEAPPSTAGLAESDERFPCAQLADRAASGDWPLRRAGQERAENQPGALDPAAWDWRETIR